MSRSPKYGNRKTERDGYKFDSKREADRWSELVLLQKAGKIYGLRRQPKFDLIVNGMNVCRYIADFEYRDENDKPVTEDVKSEISRKLSTYRLKRKLMMACLNIEVVEIL